MKSIIFIMALLGLLSCNEGSNNDNDIIRNYTPIPADTNCLSPWSNAFFKLKTKNIDTVIAMLNSKIVSVLGSKVFNDDESLIMRDSIRRAIFPFDSAFIKGDIQIDTIHFPGITRI